MIGNREGEFSLLETVGLGLLDGFYLSELSTATNVYGLVT